MIIVDVLEFRLPNGQQIPQKLEIDDSCLEKYNELTKDGFRLTFEQLTTGEGSICIEHPDLGDLDSAILMSFQSGLPAVEGLIKSYDRDKAKEWIVAMGGMENDTLEDKV